MEGVLWVRVSRGKLLHGWQKRYFVLSDDGVLKEFAESTPQKPSSNTSSSSAAASATAAKRRHSGGQDERSREALVEKSGMMLKDEVLVLGATVKTLPFPLVGRNNAFQVVKKGDFRMSLAAKSADDMHQWVGAIRAIASIRLSEIRRQRSPAISGRLPPSAPWTRSPSLEIGTARTEDEFLDVPMLQQSDVAKFVDAYEWFNERVRTTRDLSLRGVALPRGSVLVAANGISLQTLTTEQVKLMLNKPSKTLALGLRFLRTPYKKGVLKCKMCFSLTTQLKTIAQYRNGLRDWKQQVVEVDGDVLTCYPRAESKLNKTRRLIPLVGGCAVKTVHEIVAEQKFCFMVSVKSYSMLFQARSDEEVRNWTEVIQRAILLAEGVIPGQERPSLDNLQLQSSLNMRSLQNSLAFADADDAHLTRSTSVPSTEEDEDDGEDGDWETSSADDGGRAARAGNPVYPSTEDWTSATQSAAYLPAHDLSEMLFFLQRSGRFVEAFQLMGRNTSHRSEYWKKIFLWALDPIDTDAFEKLYALPLAEADSVQVQKDIPRTSKWLAGSAGAPQLSPEASRVRLERLEHVLHAFLSGCTSHVRTDEDEEDEATAAATGAATIRASGSKNFYMQGMNGLAFILLEVLDEAELDAFQFFRGIIARILPHVFGIRSEGTERDNFDLFSSLVEVGNILQEVVALHLPNFNAAMDDAGIPVCLLAYKWFPTLFSDISLMAHNAQLRFDTLLVIWDICLLMGLEGIFCVSLALFSSAEENVVSIGRDASAEQTSNALVHVLSQIKPEDLITSVCEVLELCSHPVLLKLRNGHRRRLQLGYAKQQYDGVRSTSSKPVRISTAPGLSSATTSSSTSSSSGSSDRGGSDASNPMTVRDLDSGKLFKISRSGNMLLPVMKAVQ